MIDRSKPSFTSMSADKFADIKNLLTVSEFAKMAGVSPQAIHLAIKQQRIRAVKKGPIYLIDENELSNFFK